MQRPGARLSRSSPHPEDQIGLAAAKHPVQPVAPLPVGSVCSVKCRPATSRAISTVTSRLVPRAGIEDEDFGDVRDLALVDVAHGLVARDEIGLVALGRVVAGAVAAITR